MEMRINQTAMIHMCKIERKGSLLIATCDQCPRFKKTFDLKTKQLKTEDPGMTILEGINHHANFAAPGLDLKTGSNN